MSPPPLYRIGAVLAACLLTACAINPPLNLAQTLGEQPPLQLQSVPFFEQQEYQCGPAALAAVLGASGVAVTPASLSPQVFLPGRRGSLQLELLGATRRAGRIPYLIENDIGQLFAQLQAGEPVLVLQNLQTRDFPVWHYAVLTGFDTVSNQVYLNSGAEQGLAMTAPAFLRTWDWAGRWAMLALPPGRMPAEPQADQYIAAVATFETVAGGVAAAPAWDAALRRWPNDARPYLALGNLAYNNADLPGARDYFDRGLKLSPTNPALSNNLASVLGELGCPAAGLALLAAARAGLTAESNWRPVIDATAEELHRLGSANNEACAYSPANRGSRVQ